MVRVLAVVLAVISLVSGTYGAAEKVLIDVPNHQPAVKFGAEELAKAIRAAGRQAEVRVGFVNAPSQFVGGFDIVFRDFKGGYGGSYVGADGPEAYALMPNPAGIDGMFNDEAGGMYALLDLAEQVRLKGLSVLNIKGRVDRKPYLEFRGVNPFLSIPIADKNGNRDWEHWWFTDEKYWRGYLDLLAKAHINWIDMHAMFDLQVTSFPNAWPYFVASTQYPDVGVEPEQARKNLAMLAKVCKMAKERGIKIALMNYTGGWNWPGCRKAPERPVADFIEYTKEGLKQIVEGCPDLGMIGFRIGESGYGEDFYAKSYLAALNELGKPLPLYTRTWGAKKSKLMELGGMYPDKFIIEIKYNGEQMGPPWHVAGGRMATWRDYSYQDYLFYPRAYKVVWQIRANGTHRVFEWAPFERIRDCCRTANLAGSIGFCVEPESTYYPVTDFLHKKPLFRWEYERNPLWYVMWGRLAYDPNTPEAVFKLAAREHWGAKYGDKAYALLQSLSRIVPTAQTQMSLGPDHRDHAPELEWGGSIRQWAQSQPFDTMFAMGPAEYAKELSTGNRTGKRTPRQAADLLDEFATETDSLVKALPAEVSSALDDLRLDGRMTASLGRYYAARLRAAIAYAVSEQNGMDPELARMAAGMSAGRWRGLAEIGDSNYRPFLDRLRMHTENYLWSQSAKNFARDATDLGMMLVSDIPIPSEPPALGDGAHLKLKVRPDKVDRNVGKQSIYVRGSVSGLKPGEQIRTVDLLWKPFRSESDWQRIPMDPFEGGWAAKVEVDSEGALYGMEVITNQSATVARVDGSRPYGVIDPWPVP